MQFDEFFKAATGTAPYAYQRAFGTAPVFPDLLEAPTGSGKTATAVLGVRPGEFPLLKSSGLIEARGAALEYLPLRG